MEPDDPRSYYSVSKRLSETIPNSFYVNQYDNLDNRMTHYTWTAPEMYEQTQGDFDVFMASIGTGGTISGCGKYFKEKMGDKVQVIGVDCEGSIVYHYARTGEMIEAKSYVLEGVGEDFIPENYDFDYIDEYEVVGDKESFLMTRKLLKQEGIYAGGSAGAAVLGAIKYAKKLKEPKKILVLLHDSGNRYASKIYNDDWMSDNGYLDSSFNVQISEVLKYLGKENQNVITIPDNATIGDAIKVFDEKGISQLPVMGEGTVKGIVAEKDLLKPVFQGAYNLDDSISLATSSKFTMIDCNQLLSDVTDKLIKKDIVLVTENDKLCNVLTDIDILHFINDKESN